MILGGVGRGSSNCMYIIIGRSPLSPFLHAPMVWLQHAPCSLILLE
jgi:hypothetical protein